MGANLRFVFRKNFRWPNLILTRPHPAQAAESAALQNEFWEMHDIVYENQEALEDADLRRYATTVGLDVQKMGARFFFGRCRVQGSTGFHRRTSPAASTVRPPFSSMAFGMMIHLNTRCSSCLAGTN